MAPSVYRFAKLSRHFSLFPLLLVATAALAAAEEETDEDQISISPDKRFAVRKDNDDDGPFFKVIERKTKHPVGRLPQEGGTPFVESAEIAWAPDSKSFAWNHREGGRYAVTHLYQWKNGKFAGLKDLETNIGYGLIEADRLKQLKEAGLPKDSHQRRIVDTWSIKRWIDATTAELMVNSIRTVPLKEGEDFADLTTWVRYHIKLDPKSGWKITKTHLLTEKEAEAANQEN